MSICRLSISQRGLVALTVGIIQILPLTSLSALAAESAVRLAGNQVFAVGSGAGGFSSEQRAQIIQRNLDNALVAATDRSPAAVGLTYVKGAPVITVGGYYVATVDANSARAEGMTPAVLAEKWASSLKKALSDKASTNSYVAHLSGDTTAGSAVSAGAVASQTPDPIVSERQ